jgi:hypothetical protein
MCSAYQCGSQAAGHNALRGSGPGQKLAFDDALAQVGCPDHRIDRFCITCCPPFPTVPSRHCRRDLFQVRLAYRAKATGSLYLSPLAIIAQAMRAILLASAIAATFVGRRSSSLASHGRCFVP